VRYSVTRIICALQCSATRMLCALQANALCVAVPYEAYDLRIAVRIICALQRVLQCDVRMICALQCDVATVHSALYTPHMSTMCGVY